MTPSALSITSDGLHCVVALSRRHDRALAPELLSLRPWPRKCLQLLGTCLTSLRNDPGLRVRDYAFSARHPALSWMLGPAEPGAPTGRSRHQVLHPLEHTWTRRSVALENRQRCERASARVGRCADRPLLPFQSPRPASACLALALHMLAQPAHRTALLAKTPRMPRKRCPFRLAGPLDRSRPRFSELSPVGIPPVSAGLMAFASTCRSILVEDVGPRRAFVPLFFQNVHWQRGSPSNPQGQGFIAGEARSGSWRGRSAAHGRGHGHRAVPLAAVAAASARPGPTRAARRETPGRLGRDTAPGRGGDPPPTRPATGWCGAAREMAVGEQPLARAQRGPLRTIPRWSDGLFERVPGKETRHPARPHMALPRSGRSDRIAPVAPAARSTMLSLQAALAPSRRTGPTWCQPLAAGPAADGRSGKLPRETPAPRARVRTASTGALTSAPSARQDPADGPGRARLARDQRGVVGVGKHASDGQHVA